MLQGIGNECLYVESLCGCIAGVCHAWRGMLLTNFVSYLCLQFDEDCFLLNSVHQAVCHCHNIAITLL